MPQFTISILTYRGLDHAKRCIASVMAHSKDFELILTDNGCPEDVGKYFDGLAATNPKILVVHNATNEGFINPNRNALKLARGEFFVMLNDDAEVPSDWLLKLQEPFLNNPRMGLTGPKGGCNQFDANIQGGPGPNVEYVEGACVMGRTLILRRYGLFAEELEFAYWEDVDLSLRLREQGFSLKLVDFKLAHIRGATSKKVPNILSYQNRNGAYIRRRFAHYFKVRRMDFPTIIRRNAANGDVLLATPLIRHLKSLRPMSPIWVETICGDVLKNNPSVERTDRQINAPPGSLVFDLNMAYENTTSTHVIDAYDRVCGVVTKDRRTAIFPSRYDIEWAQDMFPADKDWIAVHAGPTTWRGKNWQIDRWVELIPKLPGKVILVGNETGQPLPFDIDLRGLTSITQMAAVMRCCKLFVGLDSLPIHVAQAMGVPVVGLFGVTAPEFLLTEGSPWRVARATGPMAGSRHREAGRIFVDDTTNCMGTISVQAVLDSVKEMDA